MLVFLICLSVVMLAVAVVVWRIRRAVRLLDRILRESRAGVRELVKRPM